MKKSVFVWEILVLLGFISLINLLWSPLNPGYAGVNPHPYGIVILVIGIRYGLKPAVSAAALSSLIYALCLIVLHNVNEPAVFFEFQNFQPFVLFFTGGSIIGYIRTGQIQKQKLLQLANDELNNRLKDIRKEQEKSVLINNELSERILFQTTTVSMVYQLMRQIHSKKLQNIPTPALEFLGKIGVEKSAFFEINNDQFKLLAQRGVEKEKNGERKGIGEDEVVQLALCTRKVSTIRQLNQPFLPSHFASSTPKNIIAALPITCGIDKKPVGLIIIEQIPFQKFNPDTLSMFSILADWISYSLTDSDQGKSVDLQQVDSVNKVREILFSNPHKLEKSIPEFRKN